MSENSALGPIEVPASVVSGRIDMIVHAELSPLGFERVRPRFWVEGLKRPIRRIFEFQPRKGARYCACWGFSLDFVPIKKGGRLRWKRTSKTAAFDLCIDPVNRISDVTESWCVSRFIFPLKAYDWNKFARIARSAVLAAQPDFAQVKSIEDIVSLFEQRSAMKFRTFQLDNYVQTHLAWGLCLIASGKAGDGERHLEKYCADFSIDRGDRILREAERQAIELSLG